MMRVDRGLTTTATKGSRRSTRSRHRLGGVGRILGGKEAGVRERPEKMRLSLSLTVKLRPIRQKRIASVAAKAKTSAEAETKGR